ncbi:MAG: hypothetical protein JXM73_03180, partial [Anaerolineae bacterium]|nr:hypothetical protein [Anaerolineae bacterium]
MKRTGFSILALLLVASMILTACGGTAAPTAAPAPTTAPTTAPEVTVPKVDFAVMPGGELEKALTGAYKGKTVTVDGPFT